MSNLDVVKRAAVLLDSKDSDGFQTLMADDLVAKGPTLELFDCQGTKNKNISRCKTPRTFGC